VRIAAVVLFAVGIVLAPGCKKPNHAPDTPAVPSGPSTGAVGVSYTFMSSAADPDGDDVVIRFDWGDGDTSDWSAFVYSGVTVTKVHTWAASGTFDVKAQTKDKRDIASAWSAGHSLVISYQWSRAFGGRYQDYAKSIQQTQDGGYVVVGYTESYGAGYFDVWLVKTDASGDTAWTRTFGGKEGDYGNSVQQTQDGGYIVAGFTGSYGAGFSDVWLVKTDASGDVVWTKTFGGVQEDNGYSVRQTADGGYIIAGYTESRGAGDYDVRLIKTDANGDTVWTRTFGGEGLDWGYSVRQTQDGGYIVAGCLDYYGPSRGDVWLIKTDVNGDTLWTRTFGGSSYDQGNSVRQTQDGGYIIAGYTESYGAGYFDIWLVKTDAAGDTVWTRTFGGAGEERSSCVAETQDGGYVVVGYTWSYGAGEDDVWLMKTDAGGNEVWSKTFGGTSWDDGNSVQQTQDGGY
jgi:hypothetical protein